VCQRVHLDLGPSVTRVPTRDEVGAPQELAVRHDHGGGATAEPLEPVDGDGHPRRPGPPSQLIRGRAEHDDVDGVDRVDGGGTVIRRERQRIDRDLGGAGAFGSETEGAGEVGPRRGPEPHERAGVPRRQRGQVGVVAGDLDVRRARRRSSPGLAVAERTRHCPRALDAAITPRKQASAAARAVSAVAGFGATSPI
jgi:hypothetical protein